MKNIISMVRKSRVTLSNCGVMLPKKKSPSAANLKNLNILKVLKARMNLIKPMSRVMPIRGKKITESVGRIAMRSMML